MRFSTAQAPFVENFSFLSSGFPPHASVFSPAVFIPCTGSAVLAQQAVVFFAGHAVENFKPKGHRRKHQKKDANENQPTVSNWKYLENRRALVGSGCTVNKLVSAVGVGEWVDSLGNITNEDLSDYATFPSVLKAGVTVNPIVSVRDKNNYYGEGTEAGFCVVASSGAKIGRAHV